eukprot:Plantae.Rhodophyta-Hildenbrandia_rubra.ctg475.p1 GENE.Plantae.Rhodophyta-Hildenbrandia_rubra.ctg475~~Plantae.Rhodophyta-Hildenbrandia_rubra.ctg475.p1  ORF type:complete len:1589 (-),score=227.47 Plantae.Rhodophyta-Hildenbrandia_rubra.ctg475:1805-6571(-)
MVLSNRRIHLTVHYRRHRRDYTGQRLKIAPLKIATTSPPKARRRVVPGIAQSSDENGFDSGKERWDEGEVRIADPIRRKGGVRRTAWGVVYRLMVSAVENEKEQDDGVAFNLSILGRGDTVEEEWKVDNVGKDSQDRQVWIMEGCQTVGNGVDAFKMEARTFRTQGEEEEQKVTQGQGMINKSSGRRFVGILVERSTLEMYSLSRCPWIETKDGRKMKFDLFAGDIQDFDESSQRLKSNEVEKRCRGAALFLLDRSQYKTGVIFVNPGGQATSREGDSIARYVKELGDLVLLDIQHAKVILKPLDLPMNVSKFLAHSFPPRSFSPVRVLSPRRTEKSRNRRAAPKGSRERCRLVIHYKRYARDYHNINLVTSAISAPVFVAATKREGVFNAAVVFSVDLMTLPPPALRQGINIMAVWTDSGLPLGDEVTYDMSDEELGVDLLMRQGEFKLLPLAVASAKLFYHRYGSFDDYEQWKLTVWDKADEAHKTHIQAYPEEYGSAHFDLSSLHFPRGSIVCFQPIKVQVRDAALNGTLDTRPGSDAWKVTASDIVRTVSSEELAGDIHCWQGSPQLICKSAKESIEQIELDSISEEVSSLCRSMEDTRYLSIKYRRHNEDYVDWDLWVWDASDPENRGHSVEAQDKGDLKRASEIDFSIDLALFGSGTDIRIIGRRGGSKWLAKDEPARQWCRPSPISVQRRKKEESISKHGAFSVCMIEGLSRLLRSYSEIRDLLKAYVNENGVIFLKLPVPFEWVQESLEVKITMCKQDISHLTTQGRLQAGGKPLSYRGIERVGLTDIQCTLENEHNLFDEDFPVEKVLIQLPGFNPVALRWLEHHDMDAYYYSGQLGWQYKPSQTTFRVFAPTATLVSVILYQDACGENKEAHPMRRIPEGCWKTTIYRDLNECYYKLLAEGEDKRLFPGVEVIDPYSRCNTSHTGRGLIFAKDETPIAPSPPMSVNELIVYELHVRDISIDENSGVSNSHRGRFLGLAERGTKVAQPRKEWGRNLVAWHGTSADSLLSTCLDHIVEMGVNAVQIMPIQDFDNDEDNDKEYNWGYMPVHYNSPDGWYTTGDKASASRVAEFKTLVSALHEAGLKVIMDVVYNHTAEDPNELNLEARFSFNGLAPRYYYRTCSNVRVSHDGRNTCSRKGLDEEHCGLCYSNGSGCGNEFRSESPMGRKFLIDSLRYWVEEYKVDGFRFDLAGLMDGETFSRLASELPGTILYGEPWTGGLTPIKISDKGTQRSKGFAFFNNDFRDALRGSSFSVDECFLMDGGRVHEVKEGIIGSLNTWTDSPQESINYIECHDNRTLYDHMVDYRAKRNDDIGFSEEDFFRIHKLGAVVIFTSQGIPFIHAGQEMMRTKFGCEDSYKSPDRINKIRWVTKYHRLAMVRYYQGLIRLRRDHPEIFCLESAKSVRSQVTFFEDLEIIVPDRCIGYEIVGDIERAVSRLQGEGISREDSLALAQKWERIVILLNPTPTAVMFPLPGEDEDAQWIKIVDEVSAGVEPLRGVILGRIEVGGRSGAVLRMASAGERDKARLELRLASVTDAYAVPSGDDSLSEYVVSIWASRSPYEKEEHNRLTTRRKMFFEARE